MKKEIIQLGGSVDCIIDIHLNPKFEIDGKAASMKDCCGQKIKHLQKANLITLLLPTYNKNGYRKGTRLQSLTIDQVKAMYNQIKEIDSREAQYLEYYGNDSLPL